MNALRWGLNWAVFGAMIALCLINLQYAGVGGLAGGALGFLFRFLSPGQSDAGERMGNGYIGALTGLCLGYAVVGFGQFVFLHYQEWLAAIR